MKAIIVDDENKAVLSLKTLLRVFAEEVEVVATASTVSEAIETIKANNIDLLFLDIELGDGLGIEVLQSFPNRNFKTVFVTAYDQYAIQAFRLHAFDYLLKPVDPDDLEDVVARIKNIDEVKMDSDKGPEIRRFSVPTQNGLRILDTDQVVRFNSANNYTYIVLEDETILVTKTLKKFEESLCTRKFIRVHQSHIVNFGKVKEYDKGEGGRLIMCNGDEVPLSKKSKVLLEKALQLSTIAI